MSRVIGRHGAARPAALLIALACLGGTAAAQEPAAKDSQVKDAQQTADPGTLRICAAEQPPLSLKDGSGLENRIAVAVAEAMGRKPVFVFSGKPAVYAVRDGLDKKTCDVVVGLDSDDQRVLTTKPYYRAGYVFLTKADGNLDVKSWSDPRHPPPAQTGSRARRRCRGCSAGTGARGSAARAVGGGCRGGAGNGRSG